MTGPPGFRELASGLQFPEGPVAMDDGSVLVVELAAGTLKQVSPDGDVSVVADCGGSPNGAAIGPDGAVYVCNSGGWRWTQFGDLRIPGIHGVTPAEDYAGGSIQRVDLATGTVDQLFESCDGHRLCAPNDLVFDDAGGFWFTDHGHIRERDRDRTGIYYAKADGSEIREVIFPVDSPNGIGLSPDGMRLYVAETFTARVLSWDVSGPGTLAGPPPAIGNGGQMLHGSSTYQLFDSLAVDADGWVCVATIANGGITAISPDGAVVEHIPLPDPLVTNICFGGPGLRTAFVTLSSSGRLIAMDWPRGGLAPAHK